MPRERRPHFQLEERWRKICEHLDANIDHLVHQGTLSARRSGRRRVWSVRFVVQKDGCKRHRSIFVGGDEQAELLQRTQRRLAWYRMIGSYERDVGDAARFARALLAALRDHGLSGPGD
jgi:hypothetical protein